MKVPISWLKKYISFTGTPEKLAEDLTMSGTKLEALDKKGAETVLDLEITSNRPDCLSVLGVAREVSSLNGKKISYPKISTKEIPQKNTAKTPFKVNVEDKKSCPFYSARLIRNVTVKTAPQEMREFLELAGTRAINNVVDVTNFALYEMGQPLHAFDYEKIEGREIRVRAAFKNEKFLGLDNVEYTLDESVLVIADAKKAIAIAGVMGGKLTEVTEQTKNILLEAAYFDPMKVRHAVRKTKIATESSYRFERAVDKRNIRAASLRATQLILELAGGEKKEWAEISSFAAFKPKKLRLTAEELRQFAGMEIKSARAAKILQNLGFDARVSGPAILVEVPSFREDIAENADLIEEILRIEGFDKVKPAIPLTRHSNFIQDDKLVQTFEVKKFLAALGFHEILSYSLVSSKSLNQLGFSALDFAQKIRNPLSVEQEYFRPTLLGGMLNAAQFNLRHKNDNLKLFEIGNVYIDGVEKTHLALGWYGLYEENWRRKDEAAFYDLKGAVENLLAGFFNFENWSWEVNEAENSLFLFISGAKVACLKSLAASVRQNWDIPQEFFYAEMDLRLLLELAAKIPAKRLKSISKYPAVRRDIALLVDKSIAVQELVRSMKVASSQYLKEVRLFDEYSGKGIPDSKRSLAFSLWYQKENGTFTDDEILKLQAEVGNVLKNQFKAEFR